jgi:alpha 1,3-mannosyltransferase
MQGILSPRLDKFNSEQLSEIVSSPRKCIKIVKVLALTGCIFVCCLLLTTNYVPSRHATTSTIDVSKTISEITATHTTPAGSTIDLKPVEATKATQPLYYTIHTNKPYDIDAALRTVLDLIPDEIYIWALTEPIFVAGEERLQELGTRVRMFKKYFDAWESLHVVTDVASSTAFVRDDILRYIRDAKDVSAFTSLSRVEAIRTYETYRSFLAEMSAVLFPWTAPYFSDHMTLHGHMYNAGRGIAISGSDKQAPYIMTAISSFRAMGCQLPVEVMYLGEHDLSLDMREQLEALPNVTTRDTKQMVNDQGWELEGWAGKSFAAFLSSFREVILLDADVLFFQNPEKLFEEPGYVETGALFFRDRTWAPNDKRDFMRRILPTPISKKAMEARWWKGETNEFQEAGVVVVDKWRHFMSVFLTTRLNGPDRKDSDAGPGTYSLWYGDKESWWISFELAGDTDYHFHEGLVGNLGTVTNIEPKVKPETQQQQQQTLPSGEELAAHLDGANSPDSHQASRDAASSQPAIPTSDTPTDNENNNDNDNNNNDNDNNSNPTDDPLSPNLELENDSQVQTETKSEANRSLSRRDDLTQGENFYWTALEKKRPWLTGSKMLEMTDQNMILCSPQLLHLDLSGRPMWFNGWIQENKKIEDSPVSTFEFFMPEVQKDSTWAHWILGPDNMCCLKSDNLQAFEQHEKDILNMIVETAKKSGALNKVKEPEADAQT